MFTGLTEMEKKTDLALGRHIVGLSELKRDFIAVLSLVLFDLIASL